MFKFGFKIVFKTALFLVFINSESIMCNAYEYMYIFINYDYSNKQWTNINGDPK